MTGVVDASFSGAWLLPDETGTEAMDLLAEILEGRSELAVPELWTYELTDLLVVAHRRGRLEEAQIEEAQALIEQIPRTHYDHAQELPRKRMARFALRFGLSGYDAAYLELADRLQCVLHAHDRALHEAARALGLAPAS